MDKSKAIGIFINTNISPRIEDVSWDLLHRVIDKIESLGYNVSINKSGVFIGEDSQIYSSSYITQHVGTGRTKKEKVWTCVGDFCVEFLKKQELDNSFSGSEYNKKRCIVRIDGTEPSWLISLHLDGDPPRTTDKNLAMKFNSEVAARVAIDQALLTHPLQFRHYVIERWVQN